ncbi:MAG TPA: DinB family protein [Saprospiraceae bacterium]|nr:DinB family protein [Saprospiraceae bacterium]
MDLANSLESLITTTAETFNKISATEWTDKPNPRKWSKKEILGHLIDSAMNNLKRFNEVQFFTEQPYVVQKYRQEELVKSNRYQELPIEHLIALWTLVNMQLAYVLRALQNEMLEIAILIPEGEMQTVGWLADDYVVHLRHHLEQIFVGE